jgi:DNA-binding LacI/PurR family transcriptional regulator
MRERHEGYRDALESVGVGYDEGLVVQVGTYESLLTDDPATFDAERVRAELRKPDRPTALFVASDVLAIKVMGVIRELGLRIPEDVAIAGFDDILRSAYTVPPLTTVRQPAARIGQRAAKLLLERIGKPVDNEPVHERVPCELVVRKSSGPVS